MHAARPPGPELAGQQSLTEPVACTSGWGGGQLIEAALAVPVPAAACAQAAAGAAARVTAATASTALPARLASGREAGRRSLPREASRGLIIGFPFTAGPLEPDECTFMAGERAAGQQLGLPLDDEAGTAAGGGQLTALAAVAVRLSDPAATAAKSTTPPAARPMRVFGMA